MKIVTPISLLFFFLTGIVLTLKGQSFEIPDKFQGYCLGTALSDLKSKGDLNTHYDYEPHFSIILTKTLVVYTLKQQETRAKDKIDVDFFFYHDSLAVIRVRYQEPQSRDELLGALRGKYGNEYAFDESVYNDHSTGTSRIIENFYWGADYFLNFTASDESGIVCLTFAEKAIQAKLKGQESRISDRKID
jgi:hypothetical protein